MIRSYNAAGNVHSMKECSVCYAMKTPRCGIPRRYLHRSRNLLHLQLASNIAVSFKAFHDIMMQAKHATTLPPETYSGAHEPFWVEGPMLVEKEATILLEKLIQPSLAQRNSSLPRSEANAASRDGKSGQWKLFRGTRNDQRRLLSMISRQNRGHCDCT